MQTLARMEDRRHVQRRIVELPARVCFPGGIYVQATVRDISPMGARLELATEAVLPLRFRMQIPDDLFEVDCELRHQKGRYVGVEFTSHRAEAMARYS